MQTVIEDLLVKLSNLVLNTVGNGRKVRLLFGLIVLPILLNVFYCWIVDNILKFNTEDDFYIQMKSKQNKKNDNKITIQAIEFQTIDKEKVNQTAEDADDEEENENTDEENEDEQD